MEGLENRTDEACSGKTEKRKVRKPHWLQGRLYIIENVEAEVWGECRERYFHASVLDEIDRLLRTDHRVKEHLDVEVVTL